MGARQSIHHIQKKQDIFDRQFLGAGVVFFTRVGLDKILRQAEKSAPEALIQLLCRQVADPVKSLDLVIADQRPHFFGQLLHIDVPQQVPVVAPSFFPVVYHQCEHGVERFAFGKLVAVGCGIVVHHPRRHVLVWPGLIFNSDQRNDDFRLVDRQ